MSVAIISYASDEYEMHVIYNMLKLLICYNMFFDKAIEYVIEYFIDILLIV